MENQQAQKPNVTKAKNRISISQLAAYGSGGIIPIALFNSVGILIGMMGNISLGLSAFWLGFILIIPRLWDSFSDPIIGHYSDNARTKWGRRRPFLFIGGILTALFFVMLWWIPKGINVEQWFSSENSYQLFQMIYILMALLLFFTAVSLFEIPHGALGMEMTNDHHVRTQLFSVKSLVGNLFAVMTPWMFWLANREFFKGTGGTEMDGMRYVSLIIPALLIPLSFWWFFKLKEPKFSKVKDQKKSNFWADMKLVVRNRNFVYLTLTIFTLAMGFNFVQLLGSYIPIFYIFGGDKDMGSTILGLNGTVWAITGMAAVVPLNIISPKLGKRKTLILAMVFIIAAQISKIVCYNPEHPYLILIPTILLSAGMLFFFTLGSSMVGDICDEEELNTGKRTEGSYYSVFWWFIKLGTALASFVAGALIVLTMFDETQVTKVDKLIANMDEITTLATKWEADAKDFKLDEKTLEIYRTDAIKDLEDYASILQKELKKEIPNNFENVPTYANDKQKLFQQSYNTIQLGLQTLNDKELIKTDSAGTLESKLFPLLFQAKFEKTKDNLFDLQVYLRDKSLQKIKNVNHYKELETTSNEISERLMVMKANPTLAVIQSESKAIDQNIVPLKKQTPYTLLMMRIIEIGLPILLSLMSVFLILRYTLTEKRLVEIKELLANKNQFKTL